SKHMDSPEHLNILIASNQPCRFGAPVNVPERIARSYRRQQFALVQRNIIDWFYSYERARLRLNEMHFVDVDGTGRPMLIGIYQVPKKNGKSWEGASLIAVSEPFGKVLLELQKNENILWHYLDAFALPSHSKC